MTMVKPSYWSTIQKNHQHAEGLVACHIMTDLGSVCSDMSINRHDISLFDTYFNSEGLVIDGINKFGLIDNSGNKVVNSEKGTIVTRLKGLSSLYDGVTRIIFGNQNESWNLGEFALYKYISGDLYFGLNSYTELQYITINSVYVPNWEDDIQITVRWNRQGIVQGVEKLSININGEFVSNQGGNFLSEWDVFVVASQLGVGNSCSNPDRPINAIIKYQYIYDYVVPISLLKDIYENPYAMMKNKGMFSMFFPTLLSGNPWYHNAQQT